MSKRFFIAGIVAVALQGLPLALEAAGALNVSFTASALSGLPDLDLSAEGVSDWVHWGLGGSGNVNHKATGGAKISDFTDLAGLGFGTFSVNPQSFSWDDGSPTSLMSNTTYSIYTTTVGDGWLFTAPADSLDKVLKVYVTVFNASSGTMQASLSDGSAAPYFSTINNPGAAVLACVFTFKYKSVAPGQTLTLQWTHNSGFIFLAAATLDETPAPPLQAPPAKGGALFGYPNPVPRGKTCTFRFDPGPADMAIFDLSMRLVAGPSHFNVNEGAGTALWDGRDETGQDPGPGVYFARLRRSGVALSCKMMLAP